MHRGTQRVVISLAWNFPLPTAEFENAAPPNIARSSVGVISTEAIEQLAPVMPEDHDASLVGRIARPRGAASGIAQLIYTTVPLAISDLLVVLGCFYGTTLLASVLFSHLPHANFFWQGLAIAGAYGVIGTLVGLFPATGISPILELRNLILTGATSFGLMLLSNALVATLSPFEAVVGMLGGATSVVTLPLSRASMRHYLAAKSWWGERCIIIGAGVQGRAIYKFYQRASQRGLRPIGLVDRWESATPLAPKLDTGRFRYLGSLGSMQELVRRSSVRWGIVAPGGSEGMDVASVLKYCGGLPNVVVLPSQLMIPSLWANPRECAGVMGVHLKDHLRNPFNAFAKRSVDIVGSLIGLFLALPLFAVAMTWTKVKSPGPCFFGHSRIGKDGRPFKAWKFRTMVTDADEVLEIHLEADLEMRTQWIETQKLKDDPRIIPGVGRLLRKTSLDEIPQLWNVLKGDMSLVGPRPIVKGEIERYRDMFPLYLRVRPGLTGLWQVSGRNDTSYDERVQIDSYYVRNWSIWLDAYIVMRTVRTILLAEGAY